MLDIKFIRENKELIKENCKNRRAKVNIDEFLELDEVRRDGLKKIENLRAERNKKSKGKPSDEEIKKMREVGDMIKKLEENQKTVEEKYLDILQAIPNLSHPESPVGEETNYKVIFKNGEPPKFSFPPKTHDELMMNLDLIDFERGAKVTGTKFYFLKNDAVRLNQALINYGLDILEDHDFILFETPDMAKNEILNASGFNPRGEESQIYEIKNNDLSLIGTAEITMLGFHANEVIDLSKGPKKYAALSHCFRTEGGAYGKANKGLYRVHQFTKLEMFIFCKPEDSEKMHQELLVIEKKICDGLDLPYRVIDIPTGDLGGPAYRKYDIEAWMTMIEDEGKKGGYGEITSASNCADYQSRRLNIKYKKDDGSMELLHTLNGTAIVSSRFPVALLENHQQKDGSIKIPKALKKYFGKKKISKP